MDAERFLSFYEYVLFLYHSREGTSMCCHMYKDGNTFGGAASLGDACVRYCDQLVNYTSTWVPPLESFAGSAYVFSKFLTFLTEKTL